MTTLFLIAVLTVAQVGHPRVGHIQTITWVAPTVNEDGTPIDDLAGYELCLTVEGIDPNVEPAAILMVLQVPDPAAVEVITDALTADTHSGTYSWWIRAYDQVDNFSTWAGPVTRELDKRKPRSPDNLDVRKGKK